MDARLLESGKHKDRPALAAIPSIALHGILILAAIHATAHAALTAAPIEPAPMVRLRVPVPATTRHDARRSRGTSVAGRWAPPVGNITTSIELTPVVLGPQVGAKPVVSTGDFASSAAVAPISGLGTVPGILSAPEVDRQVVAVPGSLAPVYPDALRSAGVQGTVVAAFVVDTTGRVEPGSFRLLEPANAEFVAAVRNSLARARFVPAESHGEKVRQLVEQPFTFVIR